MHIETAEGIRKTNQNKKKKKKIRSKDAANFTEFLHAVKVVEQKDRGDLFVKSRDIVTLLILFFTGTKISHLLDCTVNTLQPLLNRGIFRIPVGASSPSLGRKHIERGVHKSLPEYKKKKREKSREVKLPVTRSAQNLALRYKEHIERICLGKEGQQKVITAKGNLQPIARAVLDARINLILKQTSRETQKNLTSHSFRIGQVNHLIQIVGLPRAHKIIGHRDIRTTASSHNYSNQGKISRKESRLVYQQLDQLKYTN